jgi:hypothetical protein
VCVYIPRLIPQKGNLIPETSFVSSSGQQKEEAAN